MDKIKQIYEGKAKILYTTQDKDLLIQYFKDDATAFNAKKKGTIDGKGIFNNQISAKMFQFLESQGIPTHFEKLLNEREMLVKRVEIVQVEVIIRNRAAGSLSRLLGIEEGRKLKKPILEFCYKRDDLGDPLINEDHILALNLATPEEIQTIKKYTLKINELMTKFFLGLKLELIDFKLEFGRYKGEIVLGDEICPDTCRFWDSSSGERMDKDRFRRDLGGVEAAYQEIARRVGA